MIHSPFHVVEDFISPLRCEELIARLALRSPDVDETGALKHERNVPAELGGTILSELDAISPMIEERYGATMRGDPTLRFQQYWENLKRPAELHNAEGWEFKRKKWQRTKDVDLVGIIWLKDYHDSVPLDPRIEVYGGKLEFPAYDFSLTPVRGTLVVFPALPHFVNATSHVLYGTLEQIKVNITLNGFSYDPTNFPGSYTDWFIGTP